MGSGKGGIWNEVIKLPSNCMLMMKSGEEVRSGWWQSNGQQFFIFVQVGGNILYLHTDTVVPLGHNHIITGKSIGGGVSDRICD